MNAEKQTMTSNELQALQEEFYRTIDSGKYRICDSRGNNVDVITHIAINCTEELDEAGKTHTIIQMPVLSWYGTSCLASSDIKSYAEKLALAIWDIRDFEYVGWEVI